ncbi:MAG TPA: Fe(3+) ABC transporter substrate-binding protein [Thiotrichaceae bacterium]|nr:Fe(3+) ABC transporter substrate-binding protein [Thiotrichaceae bacterium]
MNFSIPRVLLISSLLTSFLLSAAIAADSGEVNLYSARKEKLIKPLLDEFSKQTGITVNLVTGKADALLKRLQVEGRNSPADLFITTDAGRLYRAKKAGVLQSVESEVLNKAVPEALRDSDNQWFGLSQRARPIFYVKGKVDPEELSTYEALADDKWNKRICIRSSSNIYNQSLVASMIANTSEKRVSEWAEKFVKNFARSPKGGDRDQILAAAAGVCDIAIANTYYVGKMLNSKDKAQGAAAEKMAVFWPNQEGRGAHVNVSGIAMTKSAVNKENALKLMVFLLNEKSQKWYAEANQEYPVLEGVAWSETLDSFGKFKADSLNLTQLGELNADAVRLMDRAHWR